jgi:hypothetical protein
MGGKQIDSFLENLKVWLFAVQIIPVGLLLKAASCQDRLASINLSNALLNVLVIEVNFAEFVVGLVLMNVLDERKASFQTGLCYSRGSHFRVQGLNSLDSMLDLLFRSLLWRSASSTCSRGLSTKAFPLVSLKNLTHAGLFSSKLSFTSLLCLDSPFKVSLLSKLLLLGKFFVCFASSLVIFFLLCGLLLHALFSDLFLQLSSFCNLLLLG